MEIVQSTAPLLLTSPDPFLLGNRHTLSMDVHDVSSPPSRYLFLGRSEVGHTRLMTVSLVSPASRPRLIHVSPASRPAWSV